MASSVDKMKIRFAEIVKDRDDERVEKQLAQAEEVRLMGELEMMTRRTRKKTIQVEQAEKIKDNFMELIHSGHYGSSKEVSSNILSLCRVGKLRLKLLKQIIPKDLIYLIWFNISRY